MKKIFAVMLTLVMLLTVLTVPAFAKKPEDTFGDWNENAPALQALVSYVEEVTNAYSPDYIPVADRIAVFDMDGTLCGELYPTYLEYYLLMRRIFADPSYEPDAEMLEFGQMLRDHALDKSFPDGMDVLHGVHAAKAYAGMTLTEFADFVTNQIVRDVDGFEYMTYANSFYLPMVEVVEYLQDNDFKVYVVSGSDRFICRTFIEGILDIPYEQIIGMDVELKAVNQEGADGLNYVFTSDDMLVRTDKMLIKNLKMNKVTAIAKEIGKQPVLSFGNSSGDVSMHNFTIYNNKYKSEAFMLVADDEERDYGSVEKGEALKEKWKDSGFNVISMRDDFRTIYGDEVVKTGSFTWMDDYAGTGIHEAPATPIDHVGGAEDAPDVQYVLFLGTNDKDTNTPVYTQAESMNVLEDILIRHFGGYTIQEAHGGWIDGDTKYQEYTLVIYLSDTTKEAVYAAADEMVKTFRQSSVMIQENPTRTEFYAPAE